VNADMNADITNAIAMRSIAEMAATAMAQLEFS
jgi:hypothetical protein